MESSIELRNPKACRACDNVRGNIEIRVGVYRCASCEAIFGQLYLGDSYSLVKPYFAAAEVPADHWRYFDFSCVGSQGITRRHGWFDPSSGLITQVG